MVQALVERLDFAFNIESTDSIILDGIVQCQSIENSGHALRAQEVVERAQSRVVRLLTLLLLLDLLLTEDALSQPVVIIRIRIGSGGDDRKANGTNRQLTERHARPPTQGASADAKTRPVQRVLDFQIRGYLCGLRLGSPCTRFAQLLRALQHLLDVSRSRVVVMDWRQGRGENGVGRAMRITIRMSANEYVAGRATRSMKPLGRRPAEIADICTRRGILQASINKLNPERDAYGSVHEPFVLELYPLQCLWISTAAR